MKECSFPSSHPPTLSMHNAISFDHAEIGGDLILSKIASCAGRVSVSDSDIRSSLRIEGCVFGDAWWQLHSLNSASQTHPDRVSVLLDRTTIGGILKIGPDVPPRSRFSEPECSESWIRGALSARGLTAAGAIEIDDTSVLGYVELSNAKCAALHLRRVTVRGRFSAAELATPGNIELTALNTSSSADLGKWSKVHMPDPDECSVNFSYAQCTDMLLKRICIHGTLELLGLQCRGLLRIDECPARPAVGKDINLSGCNVPVQIDLEAVDIRGSLIMNVSTCGSLVVNSSGGRSRLGAMRIKNSHFRSHVRFLNLDVGRRQTGGTRTECASAPPPPQPSESADVDAGADEAFVPQASPRAASATDANPTGERLGILRFPMSRSRSARARPSLNPPVSQATFANPLPALRGTPRKATPEERGAARALPKTGADGVVAEGPESMAFPVEDGILVESSTFDDGLLFWSPRRLGPQATGGSGDSYVYTAWGANCNCCSVAGLFAIRDCSIHGDLDLTRVSVRPSEGPHGAQLGGGIVLDRSSVGGDICFRSPSASISGSDAVLRSRAREWVDAVPLSPHLLDESIICAHADWVEMRGARSSNIDLTGLSVGFRRDCAAAKDASSFGMVIASGAAISGSFICAVSIRPPEDAVVSRSHSRVEAHLRVSHALNIEKAQLGDVVISPRTFDAVTSVPDGLRLIMRDTRIEHLRIPRVSGSDTGAGGFPSKMDLAGLNVRSWSFVHGDIRFDRASVSAGDFVAFLQNDYRFHREMYRNVYRELLSSGDEDGARSIWIAEHRRAHLEHLSSAESLYSAGLGSGSVPPSPAKARVVASAVSRALRRAAKINSAKILDFFHRRLLTYGLSPAPVFWLIGALTAVTFVFVARNPANFELSASARTSVHEAMSDGADGKTAFLSRGIEFSDDGEVLGPGPSDWSLATSWWLTARYHIPIASIASRGDYEPTDDRCVQLALLPLIDLRSAPATGGSLPGASTNACVLDDFTPEDWFSIMSLINWLLWPLGLGYLLKRAFRAGDN